MNIAFCKSTKNASASALISLDIRSYFNVQLLLPIHVQKFHLRFWSHVWVVLFYKALLLFISHYFIIVIKRDAIKQLPRASNLPISDKQTINFLVVLANFQSLPSSYLLDIKS